MSNIEMLSRSEVSKVSNHDYIGLITGSNRKIIPFRYFGSFIGIGTSILNGDVREEPDSLEIKWKKPTKSDYINEVFNIDGSTRVFKFEDPKQLIRWYLDPS